MTFHDAEKQAVSLSATSGRAYAVIALPKPSWGFYVADNIDRATNTNVAAIYTRGILTWPPTP